LADASRVGLVIDEVDFPVEEGKVREFAVAVGDGDFRSVPLTFSTVAGHWRDQAAMVALLGLDLPRVVVGGSEWEYHASLAIGDRLRGRRVVKAVEEKQSARGPMTVITLETRFERRNGDIVVVQRDTLMELPS
jgi:hydroxyacyl-ACP dehydratase HTD2-like protein with hotdog domain